MQLKTLLVAILVTKITTIPSDNSNIIVKKITEYLKQPKKDDTKMKEIMESGKMSGFYSTDEILIVFNFIAKNYPKYILSEKIGQSAENRTIFAYHVSTSNKINIHSIKKSKILFTALHHARELLTANMIIKIFLETLHNLIFLNKNSNFWFFSDIIFVPIVNIDSHQMISNSWETENWNEYSSLRKNRNSKICSLIKKSIIY